MNHNCKLVIFHALVNWSIIFKIVIWTLDFWFSAVNKEPVGNRQDVPNSRPPEPVRPPPPARPPPVPPHSAPIPPPKDYSGGLFSSIKGGAGSFLKNLKDTSSKVMQTVQQ